jgi:hypothetical protein
VFRTVFPGGSLFCINALNIRLSKRYSTVGGGTSGIETVIHRGHSQQKMQSQLLGLFRQSLDKDY